MNANVEAGHPGAAGCGFAVVAGVGLVAEIEGRLSQIETQAGEVAMVIAGLADSHRQQAAGLREIEKALVQIDQSTQVNAATSEQTASSAQVPTDQARSVQNLLNQFQLRGPG